MFFLLESICEHEILLAILLVLHHNDFISDPSKFDSVSELKLVPFTLLEIMVLIVGHVSHDQPQFFSWIRFFFFWILNSIPVVNPKVIFLK